MEHFGYIYRSVNLINNKTYIGQRKLSADYGKNWNFYLGSGKNIISAIKKYGKNNFDKELLYFANSQEELDKLETKLIKKEMSELGSNCYNIFPGATSSHAPLRRISKEDFSKKISNSMKKSHKVKKARENTNRKLNEKYKKMLYSQKNEIIAHYLVSNNMLTTSKYFNIPAMRIREFLIDNQIKIHGKSATKETRRNISKGMISSNKINSAKVYNKNCIVCNIEFETKVEIKETCSIKCGRISSGLKQKMKLDNNKIKQMYLSGMTLIEVADILDVSFSTVSNRLKEMNVERRKPGDKGSLGKP